MVDKMSHLRSSLVIDFYMASIWWKIKSRIAPLTMATRLSVIFVDPWLSVPASRRVWLLLFSVAAVDQSGYLPAWLDPVV
jgi:hypothetical protein